jgi:nucleotide-binding universal stress UspA family protein
MTAESLLEQAGAVGADLIVAATHGLGPTGGPASRGIARAIVRQGGVPVLLVKPDASPARPAGPDPLPTEVLVTLDGSSLAEQVVEPAVELAHLSGARCTLLRVVGPRRSPGPQAEAAEAEAYLERVACGARQPGVDVATRVVSARDAAEAIVEAAGSRADLLIAMTTHGRGGLGRLLLGSKAERISLHTASPVLLYHPTGGTGS